jgi:hypothetical protein
MVLNREDLHAGSFSNFTGKKNFEEAGRSPDISCTLEA